MNHEGRDSVTLDGRLRGYAALRRRALGPSLEMPGHVRERLHREAEFVARGIIASRPGVWGRALGFLRRPWAWGALGVLLVAGLVLWPRSGTDGTEVAARQALEGQSAPQPAPPPAPAPMALSPDRSEPRRVEPREAQESAALRTAADDAPNAVRLTRPEAALEAPARTGEEPRRTVASAPSAAPAAARSGVAPPESRAAQTGLTVQVPYVQRHPAGNLPVLNSFQFVQGDRDLLIVDEDGSVYATQVRVEPGLTGPAPAGTAGRAPTSLAAPVARSPAPPAAPSAIMVNAVGTNRGLQQRVSLDANLIVTNPGVAAKLARGENYLTNQAGLNLLLRNARLEGQAVVGLTNRIPILAVPSGNGP